MAYWSRFISCLIIFLSVSAPGRAQQSGSAMIQPCAYDQVREQRHATFPEMKLAEEEMNRKVADWLNAQQNNGEAQPRYFPNGPDFIIPVVVHVVHNGEAVGTGTNISYAQIRSQVDALNAAFSKYSASSNYYQALSGPQYASVIPGVRAVDTRIRFCLATIPSPGMNWTSAAEPGVMRHNDAIASRHEYSTIGQNQLSTLTQPGTAFPSTKYMNIWVVTAIRFNGNTNDGDCPGIQGYATIAGYTGPQIRLIEGIVIRSDIFGDNFIAGNNFNLQPNANSACPNGQNSTTANRGKILAHEVGHYLGLYHTFHECTTSSAPQCALTGDLVCDTNPCDQPGAPQGCGASDMPENFMYYSDDPILNTFTAGQRDRMHAVLSAIRASLSTETNVLETGVMGADGCFAATVLAEFTMPSLFCVNQPATFRNVNAASGSNLANQWQWTVNPSAGVTISTPNASSTDITFTAGGSYTVTLTASNSGAQVRTFNQVVQVLACQLEDCRRNQVNWIFGWGYMGVDFSDGAPVFTLPPASLLADGNQETYITETDPVTGELIFFTNGVYVYDGSYNRINTTALHPLAGGDYNSSAQIISVPYPGRPRQYLLFVPSKGWDNPPLVGMPAAYPPQSIFLINMNGTPSVTPFACNLVVTPPPGVVFDFAQFAYSEQITAIPHANGRDYWIIYPLKSNANNVYLASFLLHEGGFVQQSVTLIAPNSSVMAIGDGLKANKEHNRVALKYMDFGFNVRVATASFDNRRGSFGSPALFNTTANDLTYPGGIIFYDETHIYLSRTFGSTRGFADMDLITGTITDYAPNTDFGRFAVGPDGQIYVTSKVSFQGPGSLALSRIDRVAGVPVVNTAIPANAYSGHLPVAVGANFWNLHENIYCGPPPVPIQFQYTRISCSNVEFHLLDSAVWAGYTVTWNFGDGSPAVSGIASQIQSHTYALPGTYTVTIQLSVTGCTGTALLPAVPVSQSIYIPDTSVELPVYGPVSICIGSQVREIIISTVHQPAATYIWALLGEGQVLAPTSGVGVSQITVFLGQNPGPRTIQVSMEDAGCTISGNLTINYVLPGPANAGLDGQLSVCSGLSNNINLYDLITGEQSGGNWVRISGTGGVFNAPLGTFITDPATTVSVFQYIIPAALNCSTADTSEVIIQVITSAGAGDDGGVEACRNSGQVVSLFDVLTAESTGGNWVRVSGTGGTFDATAGTFTITSTATSSMFQYIVAGSNGCANDTSFAEVIVYDAPDAGGDGTLSICDNNLASVNLFDVITGEQSGGIWVRLSGTGGSLDPLTGILTGPFPNANMSFAYQLTGSAPCSGDESIASLSFGDFDPLPDQQRTICFNETIDLEALYNLNAYTIVRNWSLNGQLVGDPSAANDPGIYEIIIGNGQSCTDTLRVTVIKSPPVIAFAGHDTVAVQNQPFQMLGSGSGDIRWAWSPADAIVSDAGVIRPVVRLSAPEYLFYLEVTGAAGCKGYDTVLIRVFKGPAYYIPNAFTPNADGLNDLFSAFPVGIISTEWFRVYNRYGQLIFETRDPAKGWDGRFKGTLQDTGTYTWMIRGKGFNNRMIDMKGTVVLIR